MEVKHMQCTARAKWKIRNGYPIEDQRCDRRAVEGYTVCQVHGAGSAKKGRGGGRPVSHGVYSKRLKKEINEIYEEFLADDEILMNVDSDIALMRTLMLQQINNAPVDEEDNPVLNHGLIRAYMRDIRDSVALKDDLISTNMIPIENVKQFLNQVMFILKRHIPEEELLQLIVEDLSHVDVLVQPEQQTKRLQGKSTRERNKDRNKR